MPIDIDAKAHAEYICPKVNPKTVMERLGHKNIKTALQTYTFNTDIMQQAAVDVFERSLQA